MSKNNTIDELKKMQASADDMTESVKALSAMAATTLAEGFSLMSASILGTNEVMESSVVTLDELSESMETAGQSSQELAAAMQQLQEAGLSETQALMVLNETVIALGESNTASKISFDELGISLINTDGSLRNVDQIVNELCGSFGTLNENEQEFFQTNEQTTSSLENFSGKTVETSSNIQSFAGNLLQAQAQSGSFASVLSSQISSSLSGVKTKLNETGQATDLEFGKPFGTAMGFAMGKAVEFAANIATLGKSGDIFKEVTSAVQGTTGALTKNVAESIVSQTVSAAFSACLKNTANALINEAGVLGIKAIAQNVCTLAQIALNAAMMAFPVVFIIGAVTAVIGIFGALFNKSKELEEQKQEAHEKEMEQHQEKLDAINAECDARERLMDSQSKSIVGGLAEIDQTEALKRELDGLVDANGNVKAGYEDRAGFILNSLNEELGMEKQIVDGKIEGYDEIGAKMEEMMNKKRAQLILEAQEEAYVEAIRNKGSAYAQLQDCISEHEAALAELQAAEESGNKKDIERAKEQVESTENAMNKQRDLYEGYVDDVATYEHNQQLFLQGTDEAYQQIYDSEANTVMVNGKKMQMSTEERIAHEKGQLDYLNQEYARTGDEKLLTQITQKENEIANLDDSFQQQNQVVADGTEQMRETTEGYNNDHLNNTTETNQAIVENETQTGEQRKEAIEEATEPLLEADTTQNEARDENRRSHDEMEKGEREAHLNELLQKYFETGDTEILRQINVEGQKLDQARSSMNTENSMTDEQYKKKIGSLNSNQQQALEIIKKYAPDHYDAALDQMLKENSAVQSGGQQVASSMGTVSDNVLSESKSNNNEFANVGGEKVKGLSSGVTGEEQQMIQKFGQLAEAGLNALSSKHGDFRTSGQQMANGVGYGVTDRTSWVGAQVAAFATTLVNRFKSEFQIKSPSRLMRDEIGKQISAGVAVGITDGMPGVSSTLSSSIQSLKSGISDMDLGMGVNLGTGNGDGVAGKQITFIQNNNSPKSLSRLEIYRQTKNALSLVGR